MEDVAVSFLFQKSICVCNSLAGCSCGNRSNSHVIVELADARDFLVCLHLVCGRHWACSS